VYSSPMRVVPLKDRQQNRQENNRLNKEGDSVT